MNRKNILLTASLFLFLAGCNSAPNGKNVKSIQEKLPELSKRTENDGYLNVNGNEKGFRLVGQYAVFDQARHQLILNFTTAEGAYCENKNGNIGQDDNLMKILIRNKDNNEAVTTQDYSNNDKTQFDAQLVGGKDTAILDNEGSAVKIDSIDANVVKGTMNLLNDKVTVKGNFEAQICK